MASSSQLSQSKIDPSVFQRLHPRAYLERFLSEGIRPDGRDPGAWRGVSVNVGSISTAEGSALVRVGDTTIVCGVKAEIAEPELDRPEHGFLVPNIDLPAMCSPRFKPGPPGEEAQVLSDRLNNVLISLEVLSTASLCIHPGKAVWVLYVDATCLNYDGNAFDATLLAMIAALKNTKLPMAKFNEETGRTTCSHSSSVPLDIRHLPLSASFGIFDSSHILADPASFEEPLLDAFITVILNEDGALNSIAQSGLATVGEKSSEEVVAGCVAEAKKRCADTRKCI
ncbi:ribosomal protein S5 domain 2-type protein [Gautieria morchelliformis]|nr:ribosomal protein S5 domain 2-type protein [Gautieria morchelliformis]